MFIKKIILMDNEEVDVRISVCFKIVEILLNNYYIMDYLWYRNKFYNVWFKVLGLNFNKFYGVWLFDVFF